MAPTHGILDRLPSEIRKPVTNPPEGALQPGEAPSYGRSVLGRDAQ